MSTVSPYFRKDRLELLTSEWHQPSDLPPQPGVYMVDTETDKDYDTRAWFAKWDGRQWMDIVVCPSRAINTTTPWDLEPDCTPSFWWKQILVPLEVFDAYTTD